MICKKDIAVFEAKQRILLRASEFICLLPHPSLSEYISNYNVTFPTKDILPNSFTEMPCGCATLTIENDNRKMAVTLDGPTTKPSIVGNRAGQLAMMVTIEFRPAGLYALTGIPQSELIDKSISFEDIDSKLSKLLADSTEKTGSVYELVASLDALLLNHMYTCFRPQLTASLQNIVGRGGNIDVKKLSEGIYYSERQLNRIFKQYVGVGAKSFSRLVRVNNAFRLLNKPKNSLTIVSDTMGFHDVSHFVRDFRLVCEITPQEYRRKMSDFYINPKKF